MYIILDHEIAQVRVDENGEPLKFSTATEAEAYAEANLNYYQVIPLGDCED